MREELFEKITQTFVVKKWELAFDVKTIGSLIKFNNELRRHCDVLQKTIWNKLQSVCTLKSK